MSTSHIPIYYEKQLVGSVSLTEFMAQERFGGHSFLYLTSRTVKELKLLLLSVASEVEAKQCPKFSGMTKSKLLWNILLAHWERNGMVEWELAALHEIHDVYLA